MTIPRKTSVGTIALFRSVYALFPRNWKKWLWLLVLAMLFLAALESFSVGLIAFYAAAVSNPEATMQTTYVKALHDIYAAEVVVSSKALLGFLSLLVIFAIFVKNIFRGFVVYGIARYSAEIEAFFGHRLLQVFLFRDYQWSLGQNSADLVQTVIWRHYLGRHFITAYLNVLSELWVLLALLLVLFFIQPVVSVLFILVQGGASVLVYRRLRRSLDASATACRDLDLQINREATRSIHGLIDVKTTSTEEFFLRTFLQKASLFARTFGRQQFWQESPLLTLESVGFVMICGAILFMLYGLGYSPLEITGTTALLAVTAWRSLPALNRIVSGIAGIRTAQPYVQAVLSFMDFSVPAAITASNPVEKMPFKQQIEFRNVCFSYAEDQSKEVLRDFSLTLQRGKSLGVMGPSGCGKSTLVGLLTGLLRPKQGKILIDGKELTSQMTSAWLGNIGYVPQFPYIFDGSLAANIAFGVADGDIDYARVADCCRSAAIDFLDQLPDGLKNYIGERGVRLSGGQAQRVAIARALYRDPQVLIFDEATSALDEENDKQIRALIAGFKKERTLLIVSHRESTIADCDTRIRMEV